MDVSAVNTTATAIQGLKKAQETLDGAAQNIAAGSLDPQDVVSLLQASTNFKTNVAVLRAADEMNKSLLNITT